MRTAHIAYRQPINLINWKLAPLCGESKEGDIGFEMGFKRATCRACHKENKTAQLHDEQPGLGARKKR